MFENLGHFFKKIVKTEQQKELGSKDAAKERLHLVLMQDRANVSADFLELMKQEIIDVIKKYIVVDEETIDVRLTNTQNEDESNGAPSLYANIPIINIKNDMMAEKIKDFKGVDFNKEMGIPTSTATKKQTPPKSKKNILKEEHEEVKEIFEEVDEDEDDDVTFDDLLKAAEEADKANTNTSKIEKEEKIAKNLKNIKAAKEKTQGNN